MKLSLITATYNSAATLSHCLDSVARQDYPEIEHLIIDGDSSDNTRGVVEGYYKRNPKLLFSSQADKGTYDALNKGIAKASGDVIGFLHSDDFLAADTVISQIMACFKDQEVQGVYGDLHYVDKTNPEKIIRSWKSCEYSPELLQKGWMPAHPTLFLRKSVYEQFGGFDLKYQIAADYDFILRILKPNTLKMAYLPVVITKMRMGGASNKNINNIIRKSKEDYRAMKANGIANPLWVLASKNLSKISQFF